MPTQATWAQGYWVLDMDQQCYSGVHAVLYLPLGIVFVLLYCVAPPLAVLLLLLSRRRRLGDRDTLQLFGFVFNDYK